MSAIKKTIILAIAALVFLPGIVFLASAVSSENIDFPVKELGNCQTETACRAYCDDSKNIKACINFAEKHNLMPPEELEAAKKFAQMGAGPGGCKNKESCEAYCNDISRIKECLAFAESSGIIPISELEEAKKVQAALEKGAKLPGECRNKSECENYCGGSEHMEECIAFAEAAGFMSPGELSDAKKALGAIKKGFKPPPCGGKDQCDEYCSQPANMESCMEFALAAGFIPEEKKGEMEKVLAAVKNGATAPPCRGDKECNEYCSQPENMEGCMEFAVKAGFMSKEDVEMARKTGGKGPGDCRGREECESFCQNPDNQEICFNFAKEHDLIPPEDLQRMEEGKQKIIEAFNMASPEVMNCLVGALGSEQVEKLKNGTTMPSQDIGDKIQSCFEENMPMPSPGEMPPEGMMPEEMGSSKTAPGEMMPNRIMPEGMPPDRNTNYSESREFIGPGGCRTEEECRSFCQANPQKCGISVPPNATIPFNQESKFILPSNNDQTIQEPSVASPPPTERYEELPPVLPPSNEQSVQELPPPPITIEQFGGSVLKAVNRLLKFLNLSF